MTATTKISPQDLNGRLGIQAAPVVVDVRTDEDFALDPRLIPTAVRRAGLAAADWAEAFAGRDCVVVCERGLKISQGAAAWLGHMGARPLVLEGGFQAWREAELPLVRQDAIPPRDGHGRTVWVTAATPTPDRTACTWLVRRYVDPGAVVLAVDDAQVDAVADRFAATALGEGAGAWGTFAAALETTGLGIPAMQRMSGALYDGAPEAPGLAALLQGQAMALDCGAARLEAGLAFLDALACWARRPGTAAR